MNSLTIPSTSKSGFEARVLLDSIAPHGGRLTTIEVTYPRFVHAELMTHRQFSRNSASSRAIPITKMLEKVKHFPAAPVRWQANRSGMQGGEELTGLDLEAALDLWFGARDAIVDMVELYLANGLKPAHKQIINRLLEPWLWHTVIISSTEWSNFFALRLDKDAQPEIHEAAVLMHDAYQTSSPVPIDFGEWHTPLIIPEEYAEVTVAERCKISAARCARVSYLTHDGTRDRIKDLELYERLATHEPLHASPLEHVARPAMVNAFSAETGNFRGWAQYRKFHPHECR